MNIIISPKHVIQGTIVAPPSKSLTHRAVICAVLASGTSVIDNILISGDTQRTIEACRSFGATITQRKNQLIIVGLDGRLKKPEAKIDVGQSGTTLRFITALAKLTSRKIHIVGEKRLLNRPMKELAEALNTVDLGKIKISGRTSSQYISALLLIAPYLKNGLEIRITDHLVSKQYVDITLDVMKDFGVSVSKIKTSYRVTGDSHYQSRDYTIEGDYSSASYFAAAAAITKGDITLKGLKKDSKQADRVFIDILKKMGCDITYETDGIRIVSEPSLQGIEVDMSCCPDIVLSLAAVALYATTPTKITNISHLRHKESDRIKTIASELTKMGGKIEAGDDYITIYPSKVRGTTINTHNDHRIAMMCAIAALGGDKKTTITNADVVSKSYPRFFEDLIKLGVTIDKI